MPVGEVKNLVNKLEVEVGSASLSIVFHLVSKWNSFFFQVRGKVATPRVGLCVLLLLLALLVSINIGLTLWLLFTVRLDLVSSCFNSLCFGNLLWLQILQPSLSEWWRSSHFRARRAQDRRIHAGDFFRTLMPPHACYPQHGCHKRLLATWWQTSWPLGPEGSPCVETGTSDDLKCKSAN